MRLFAGRGPWFMIRTRGLRFFLGYCWLQLTWPMQRERILRDLAETCKRIDRERGL